jgi:hypothetical protein
MRWINAGRRRLDLQILWPLCKQKAFGDLDTAKAVFAVHAFHDPAWLALPHDEIVKIIDDLR